MAEIDSENVIKELHDSLKNRHCGFVDGVGDVYAVSEETIKNIIALLKEQEPKQVETEETNDGRLYRCPSCHMAMMLRKQLYCHYCGQVVKWK